MKRSYGFLLVLLITVAGCSHSSQPVQLTVMTYNIHHGEGTDKKLDLPRIAGIIRDSGADLVALQEVDNGTERTGGVDQAAELGRLTGLNVAYGAAMDYQGGKYGNAILCKPRVKSKRIVPLAGSGGKHEPRCVLVIQCNVQGRNLVFASTHLDFTAEPSDRLDQAKIIARTFANAHRPMILAGDFNCRVGSPPLNLLAEQFDITTANDATPTSPPEQPISKIDHVLVKPRERWRTVDVKVIDERIASDHRPVIVKLELKQD
jgi:endonuclease/exonuclease/phosphatase family metal-dependent hydrolase